MVSGHEVVHASKSLPQNGPPNTIYNIYCVCICNCICVPYTYLYIYMCVYVYLIRVQRVYMCMFGPLLLLTLRSDETPRSRAKIISQSMEKSFPLIYPGCVFWSPLSTMSRKQNAGHAGDYKAAIRSTMRTLIPFNSSY